MKMSEKLEFLSFDLVKAIYGNGKIFSESKNRQLIVPKELFPKYCSDNSGHGHRIVPYSLEGIRFGKYNDVEAICVYMSVLDESPSRSSDIESIKTVFTDFEVKCHGLCRFDEGGSTEVWVNSKDAEILLWGILSTKFGKEYDDKLIAHYNANKDKKELPLTSEFLKECRDMAKESYKKLKREQKQSSQKTTSLEKTMEASKQAADEEVINSSMEALGLEL